ncbi:dispanin subfamily A member 2b-like [Sparus aurata]|uniref:Dispanin subfamily A member 2b-like n=1 Tax=Sparus aurata TaxID=8175 RepID=A0A671UDT0_SPAAU|nr:dispanin subfamily A member 2b-like [Sparus aurata]
MNPAGQPGEPVPLQERCDGFPGQPRGPAVGQYTTLNISSEPPKDHIIWSLYCFVYSNPFCLGLAALIFSIKARDRRMAGDLDGARHYASKARCLNISATVIGPIIISLICIAMYIFFATRMTFSR